jgi:hypothetical protein
LELANDGLKGLARPIQGLLGGDIQRLIRSGHILTMSTTLTPYHAFQTTGNETEPSKSVISIPGFVAGLGKSGWRSLTMLDFDGLIGVITARCLAVFTFLISIYLVTRELCVLIHSEFDTESNIR